MNSRAKIKFLIHFPHLHFVTGSSINLIFFGFHLLYKRLNFRKFSEKCASFSTQSTDFILTNMYNVHWIMNKQHTHEHTKVLKTGPSISSLLPSFNWIWFHVVNFLMPFTLANTHSRICFMHWSCENWNKTFH